MLLKVYNENPSQRHILKIVEVLRKGGVIIYPTDTVYGMGCDINNQKAVEKIARLKGIKLSEANFSIICHDLSHLSDFTRPISNHTFKLLKHNIPGPFTFILNANNNVPKLFKSKKKTVGIRVPDNNIINEIVRELGNPIMSTSVRDSDDILEYFTDPELIHEHFSSDVDIVIDGGYGGNLASTVVDLTGDEEEILREGLGELRY